MGDHPYVVHLWQLSPTLFLTITVHASGFSVLGLHAISASYLALNLSSFSASCSIRNSRSQILFSCDSLRFSKSAILTQFLQPESPKLSVPPNISHFSHFFHIRSSDLSVGLFVNLSIGFLEPRFVIGVAIPFI